MNVWLTFCYFFKGWIFWSYQQSKHKRLHVSVYGCVNFLYVTHVSPNSVCNKLCFYCFLKSGGKWLKWDYLTNTKGLWLTWEIFLVKRAHTERLRKSAIVNMQKLLNKDVSERREVLKRVSNYMPVNYGCMQSISLWK